MNKSGSFLELQLQNAKKIAIEQRASEQNKMF